MRVDIYSFRTSVLILKAIIIYLYKKITEVCLMISIGTMITNGVLFLHARKAIMITHILQGVGVSKCLDHLISYS